MNSQESSSPRKIVIHSAIPLIGFSLLGPVLGYPIGTLLLKVSLALIALFQLWGFFLLVAANKLTREIRVRIRIREKRDGEAPGRYRIPWFSQSVSLGVAGVCYLNGLPAWGVVALSLALMGWANLVLARYLQARITFLTDAKQTAGVDMTEFSEGGSSGLPRGGNP